MCWTPHERSDELQTARHQRCGTMIPAAHTVPYGEDSANATSMRYLCQCPWGLILMASTPFPGAIPNGLHFNKPQKAMSNGSTSGTCAETTLAKSGT
jgi:hypothetical protein